MLRQGLNVEALSGFADRTTIVMTHRITLYILFTLACSVLVSLGLWQLERAAQKRERYAAYSTAFADRPLEFDAIEQGAASADYRWRRVHLSGRYLEVNVLLDNRIRHGRVGYEVLTPFLTDGGRTILVDRGWTVVPGSRSALPEVAAGDDATTLAGYLGDAPVVGLVMDSAAHDAEWLSPQLLRVQRVALDGLSDVLGHELWPAVVYLDGGQPAALVTEWPAPGDGSARHTAYAVQWFAMAVVLAAIGWWQVRRRGPIRG